MLANIGSKLTALVQRVWSGDTSSDDGVSPDDKGAKRLGKTVSRVFKVREKRSEMRRVASVYFGDFRRRAVVCDMSPGGAMIEMRMPPAVGEKVLIDIPGMAPLTGQVRWRLEGRAGVQFETPILNTEIMECLVQGETDGSSLHVRNKIIKEYRIPYLYPAACTA